MDRTEIPMYRLDDYEPMFYDLRDAIVVKYAVPIMYEIHKRFKPGDIIRKKDLIQNLTCVDHLKFSTLNQVLDAVLRWASVKNIIGISRLWGMRPATWEVTEMAWARSYVARLREMEAADKRNEPVPPPKSGGLGLDTVDNDDNSPTNDKLFGIPD